MKHTKRFGCSPIALAGLLCCLLLSGCILAPRQLAGPDCGRGGFCPQPPHGEPHHHYAAPHNHGNPYVVYPPSGGTVSITPGGIPPE